HSPILVALVACGRDRLAHTRGNFARIPFDGGLVIGGQDEPRDAVVEGDARELIDPSRGWPLQQATSGRVEAPADVEKATDGAWVASGRLRPFVDMRVQR